MKYKIEVENLDGYVEYSIYQRSYWWIIPVGWTLVLNTQNLNDVEVFVNSKFN